MHVKTLFASEWQVIPKTLLSFILINFLEIYPMHD